MAARGVVDRVRVLVLVDGLHSHETHAGVRQRNRHRTVSGLSLVPWRLPRLLGGHRVGTLTPLLMSEASRFERFDAGAVHSVTKRFAGGFSSRPDIKLVIRESRFFRTGWFSYVPKAVRLHNN